MSSEITNTSNFISLIGNDRLQYTAAKTVADPEPWSLRRDSRPSFHGTQTGTVRTGLALPHQCSGPCFTREKLGHFYKGMSRLNGPQKEKELTTSNTNDGYGNLSTLSISISMLVD